MDLTPEYVEMCRKATEIQKLWKSSMGDWYAWTYGDETFFDVYPRYMTTKGYAKGCAGTIMVAWLPRQDQLQEIIPNKLSSPYGVLDRLTAWIRYSKPIVPARSMEQLWLSFIMAGYSKTWNGEDWVHDQTARGRI